MNTMVKKLMVVLLSAFMFMGVMPTPVQAKGHGNGGGKGNGGWPWQEPTQPEPDPEPEPTVEETAVEEEQVTEEIPVTEEESMVEEEQIVEEQPVIEEEAVFEETSAELAYPVFEREDKIGSTTVSVNAPEGALPEGTTMELTEVSLQAVQNAVDGTDDVDGTVVVAVDITFYDAKGTMIEPLAPITVTMTSEEIAKADDPQVIHVDTTAEEIEATEEIDVEAEPVETNEISDASEDTVVFDAEHFSVYAVISNSTNIPSGNSMLVIKYNKEYYAVQHDGSLKLADNYDASTNTITFEDESAARLWTRTSSGGYYNQRYQLRYEYDDGSYMYLSPSSDNGLSVNNGVDLTYSENRLYTRNTSNYIGIKENEDGTLSISGNNSQANAVEVYFASVDIPSSSGQYVCHIDIRMEAEADVTVSLAYGDYYDESGNKVLTVTRTSGEKGTANEIVPIDTEDIEHAQLTAYKSDGQGHKTTEVLDNAFYITGYEPSVGDTGAQVRSEGRFLVTTSTSTGSGNTARQDRLNNRVFYTMSVAKPVEFTLKYDYDDDGELDVLYKEDGTPITVTLYVTLSASFDYWDPRNECDGLHFQNDRYLNDWLNGDILWGTDAANGSGMDFVLGSSSSSTAKVVALEITKHYVDTNGNPITVKNDQSLTFNVYTTTDDPDELIAINIASSYMDTSASLSDYSALAEAGLYSDKALSHSDTLKVGADMNMSLIYDYDAENGIYYIEETNPAETVTDINGKLWEYDSTRIETAYAWRNENVSNAGKHVSTGTISVPEVAGQYSYQGNSHWGDPDYDDDEHGGTLFNQFLEFDVYNIYKGDEYFYVYHSSDNKVEKISMTDSRVDEETGEFNIVNETKAGFIYGGYYKGYGKTEATDDEIMDLTYDQTDSAEYTYAAKTESSQTWANDQKGEPYLDGDSTTWNKGDADNGAYTVKGTKLIPEADTVYYLKEVPDVYLAPAVYVVYDTHDADDEGYYQIKKLYQMTATDDGNYLEVGFDVGTLKGINDTKDAHKADFCWGDKVTVTKPNTADSILDAGSIVSDHHGWIAGRDVTSDPKYIIENSYFSEQPYHITPDNIKVTSVKRMIVYARNTRWKNWSKPGMTKTILKIKAAYAAVTE